MARLAHQFTMVNPGRVTADVIEANEFPDVSQRYNVQVVPTTVINERVRFEGMVPEDAVVEHIRQALEERPA